MDFERARAIRRGELDHEMPAYDELTGWIQRLPKTMLPGVLRQAIQCCILGPVFKDDDHLRRFVDRAIEIANDELAILREVPRGESE